MTKRYFTAIIISLLIFIATINVAEAEPLFCEIYSADYVKDDCVELLYNALSFIPGATADQIFFETLPVISYVFPENFIIHSGASNPETGHLVMVTVFEFAEVPVIRMVNINNYEIVWWVFEDLTLEDLFAGVSVGGILDTAPLPGGTEEF